MRKIKIKSTDAFLKKITFFLSIKYYIFIPRPLGIVVLSLEPKVVLGSNKQKEEEGGNILWWMRAGVVQWRKLYF